MKQRRGTFEDHWIALGGDAYSGKYDGPLGKDDPGAASTTELLTKGIERLHKNPALFAATDPEYFTFTINSLRDLWF